MDFKIPINSNVFNMVEYVVFDLLLAFAVYVLTCKLVGYYNCYDSLKNQMTSQICEDLRAPLFETGIVCTRKKVFYAVVALRMLSWILIFSTNVLIRGQTKPVMVKSKATVITRGSFSVFEPLELVTQRKFRRQTCIRRTQKSAYYGELRNGSCELDRDLFSIPPIEFGLEFEPMEISISGCTAANETRVILESFVCNVSANANRSYFLKEIAVLCLYNRTGAIDSRDTCYIYRQLPLTPCVRKGIRREAQQPFECGVRPISQILQCEGSVRNVIPYFLCENAVIACSLHECSGLVSVGGITHICENLDTGNQINRNASCLRATGADWNITDWIYSYRTPPIRSIIDTVAVAYGSGAEERLVNVYVTGKKQSITRISKLWIGALALKVAMVLALFISCEILSRRYGVFEVANDERRICSLIASTAVRVNQGRDVQENLDTPLRVALEDGVVRLHEDVEEDDRWNIYQM